MFNFICREAAIKDFLEKNNINFEFQKTFDWLKYKKPLKLNFFFSEYRNRISRRTAF